MDLFLSEKSFRNKFEEQENYAYVCVCFVAQEKAMSFHLYLPFVIVIVR